MTRLPIGTIVYARYTYGGETCLYHFYRIEGYTEKSVRITRLETETVYDDGKKGPHYYNDPYHVRPKMIDGKYAIDSRLYKSLRKLYTNSRGEMKFKPEEFLSYQGPWDGQPLEAYNYH